MSLKRSESPGGISYDNNTIQFMNPVTKMTLSRGFFPLHYCKGNKINDLMTDKPKLDYLMIMLPCDICSDFREGAGERGSSAGLRSRRQWGAFLGAGDSQGAVLTEDRLRASSDSPSVRPASSLELDSGLLMHTVLLGPFESWDGVRRRSRSDLSLTGAEEAILEEVFCSEEWEDRDSMLPMGVLPGLLLKVSPMQGPEKRHTRPSLKPAE